jgi:nucleolar protein 9
MPRDNKKRGRKGEKKRKREDTAYQQSKRQRGEYAPENGSEEPFQVDVIGEAGDDFVEVPGDAETRLGDDDIGISFYGLLTEDEQTYYANISSKLDANDFESEEDRRVFIAAVHQETVGKELKVASSQSSSRYLEKVLAISEAPQLRNLIGRFLGNLMHLVQHRFASHVCETLFLRSSTFIGIETQEEIAEDDDEKRSMEQLFVLVAKELQPNLGFLMTDRFGSHVMRVLFLVLSGEPLDDDSAKGMLAKDKRQNLGNVATDYAENTTRRKTFLTAFKPVLNTMILSSVSGLDTTSLRALATHPAGNPILQLLLRLELTLFGKSKANDHSSVLRRLLPEDTLEEGSESAKFLQNLIYDPTGSRLVETIVQYAPGKAFKQIYRGLLRGRMCSMARNDIASYVACKILERLSKEDLEAAMDLILPEIPALIERYRTGLIKVLVERCTVRGADVKPLADALCAGYGGDLTARLPKMLKLDAALEEPRLKKAGKEGQEVQVKATRAVDLHGSLLAQAMLNAQPALSDMIYNSLLALPSDPILLLAKDPTASRIIQLAITASTSTPQYRRKFIPMFYGHMVELATDPSGSHLADVLWDGTNGAHFMKEKLAMELQQQESVLRESRHGRSVWKNWSMDLYSRRPQEWQVQAKGRTAEPDAPESASGAKSGIELARERYAQKKAREFNNNPRGRPAAVNADG